MPRPRVLAWPIGGVDVASSRLRLYAPLAELADRLDVTVVGPDSPHRARPWALLAGADLVYQQKDARPPALALARKAVNRGVPVVYDLDDDPGCWQGMAEHDMLALASAVVVDSAVRAAAVASAAAKVTVIPCMVDLAGDPARRENPPARAPASVVTFGNRSSLESTRPFLGAIPPSIAVQVIGPADARPAFPAVDYRAFSLSTFVADIKACDVVLLVHDMKEADRKDENRLVMALSCRRPALVSPTPSYRGLLAEIGGEDLIVESPQDVARALAQPDPRRLAAIADAGYAYVWRTYAPSVISHRLLAVLLDVLDTRMPPQ